MLECVPNGKDDWKPHKKSKSLGELAMHVARLPGFGMLMLTTDVFEGQSRGPEPQPANSAERVERFDEVAEQLPGRSRNSHGSRQCHSGNQPPARFGAGGHFTPAQNRFKNLQNY